MRPGGLTALAVLNLIFCAWGLLKSLSQGFTVWVAMEGGAAFGPTSNIATGEPGMADLVEIGWGFLAAQSIASLGLAFLLMISAFGYLGLRRILGRWAGTFYALSGIAVVVAALWFLRDTRVGAFTIEHVIGLFYPVLTLFLVNVTFRRDLVR